VEVKIMLRLVCYACTFAVLFAMAASVLAADEGLSRGQLAKLGKAATALVQTKAGGASERDLGSAFCIHASGLFLTNEHVIHALGEVTLVLNPGDKKTEKQYTARVVRADKQLDLALLRIEGAKNLAALGLGSDDNLEELTEVVAFGFPFGTDLAPGALAPGRPAAPGRDYPSVSVNAGNITARRLKDGALNRIQLDATINPGNSGGPVLDKNGKVIGVVASILVAQRLGRTGINEAIPVSHVARFVARPDVQFAPPRLGPANIYQPVPFEVRVTPLLPTTAALSVELILKPDKGPERTYRLQADGDRYRVSAVPLPPPAGGETLRLLAQFDNGLLNATMSDRTFKVGDREVKFSEVRSLSLGPPPQVVLSDGKKMDGPVSGLEAVPVRLGEQSLAVSLAKAKEVKFAPAADITSIRYTLVVRQGDKEIVRESDDLIIEGLLPTPVAGAGPAGIRPPPLDDDQVVRKLPSAIADVGVGGGGRYLILHIPKEHKLAVFDVSTADFAGQIPVNEDEAQFAAGLEDVVVLLPRAGTIERWSLNTGQRDAAAALPIKGVVKAVGMGSASKGPLLVHWAVGTKELDRAFFSLIDVQTMKLMANEIKVDPMMGISYRDLVHIRASANGKVFGTWCPSSSPSGVGSIVLSDAGVQSYYSHETAGHVLPSPDGKILFTQFGFYEPQQLKAFAFPQPRPDGDAMVPACHGDSYLILPQAANVGSVTIPSGNPAVPPGAKRRVGKEGPPVLQALGKDTPIATLPNLDLPAPNDEPGMKWLKSDFTFDKHVHLIPDARLVIAIPASNDRLILYRLGATGNRAFTCIDLQAKANYKLKGEKGDQGSNLASLPTGKQTFVNVPFEVGPAMIQVGLQLPELRLPDKVEGIRLDRRLSKLHILHATHQAAPSGTLIGEYTITWADGTTATIPIRYGKELLDWWYDDRSPEPTDAKVAWRGSLDAFKHKIRLYVMTWQNPKPDSEVKTIAFAKAPATRCAPFCLAMTAEGK
jgi:hypothetical protein